MNVDLSILAGILHVLLHIICNPVVERKPKTKFLESDHLSERVSDVALIFNVRDGFCVCQTISHRNEQTRKIRSDAHALLHARAQGTQAQIDQSISLPVY